jgi:hypothetical protein
MDAEFLKDMSKMHLGRGFADEESSGNLLVASSLRNQLAYLPFAR